MLVMQKACLCFGNAATYRLEADLLEAFHRTEQNQAAVTVLKAESQPLRHCSEDALDLFVLSSMILIELEAAGASPMSHWRPVDQLILVADWIESCDEASWTGVEFDWDQKSLRRGVQRFKRLRHAARVA